MFMTVALTAWCKERVDSEVIGGGGDSLILIHVPPRVVIDCLSFFVLCKDKTIIYSPVNPQ